MDAFDVRLCEEVRRYRHLYDSSCKNYKDVVMSSNSWKEIAHSLGKDESVCRNKWKYLRDRFVKANRKMKRRSGDAGGVPQIFVSLSWLSDFIRHRNTDSAFSAESLSVDVRDCSERGVDNSVSAGTPSPRTSSPSPLSPFQSPHRYQPIREMCSDGAEQNGKEVPAKRRKMLDPVEEAIFKTLDRLEQSKDESDCAEETHFGYVVADVLKKLPPHLKSKAKFKISCDLFEIEQEMFQSQNCVAAAVRVAPSPNT